MNQQVQFQVIVAALLLNFGLAAMEYQPLIKREQGAFDTNAIALLDAVREGDTNGVQSMLDSSYFNMEVLQEAFDLMVSGNNDCSDATGNSKMLSLVSDAIVNFDASKQWSHKSKRIRLAKKNSCKQPKPQHPWTPIAWLVAMGNPIALVNTNQR